MSIQSVAIFDYKVKATNPIGGCHLKLLRDLCGEVDFTVFSVEFDNPCPEKIRWVRIPAPTRPVALLFLTYHLLAPLYYLAYCLRHRVRFDLLQFVESNLSFGTVSYSHFCHRAYLQRHWAATRATGLRGHLRWLDHQLHAVLEPWVYRKVKHIIVPSQGLARELADEYPFAAHKVCVLPNPVDLQKMHPPREFDSVGFRHALGIAPDELLLAFVALGHFERKGLPLVIEAIQRLDHEAPRLLVVGGEAGLVSAYRDSVRRSGIERQVQFTGMQPDVRPFIWAADALIFPSAYETFSLVSLEAAAAGTPAILTNFHGMGEFIRDGENGIIVERTVEGIATAIRSFQALAPTRRREMGRQAQLDAQQFGTEHSARRWKAFYGLEPVG